MRTTTIFFSFLLAAALLGGQRFRHHLERSRELAAIETQARSQHEKLEARGAALAALETKSSELVEAERRAGNDGLIELMRERASVTKSASDAATHRVDNVFANVLDNPEQQAIDREAIRNDMKANLKTFFSYTGLSPEKQEQYIDLQIDMERRKAARMSALLRGKVTVAEAQRDRDRDDQEAERRKSEILGPGGMAFMKGVGEGMVNDESKRLLNGIQQNMGEHKLTPEQGERLRELIKVQMISIPLDDTDLFRPPDEWVQVVQERHQNVLRDAAAFLTPAQLERLQLLATFDIAQRKEAMMLRRGSFGIK